MTQAIPDGIERTHVLAALRDLDSGIDHEFAESLGYDLVHDGKRYPPKAVLGIAARHAANIRLGPYDFKGGDSSKSFRILRDLGFTIVPKAPVGERRDWMEEEVRALVSDYFSMLADQEAGTPYSKTAHRRALQPHLNERTEQAIEYKHRNVSSVLLDLNFPYLKGYLPAQNKQLLLINIVREYLGTESAKVDAIARASDEVAPAEPSAAIFSKALEDAPPGPELPEERQARKRQARRFDFRAKDEANRKLGRAGEEFVVAYERWRLDVAGRSDLSKEVVWLSEESGDGAGYDIESFEPDGTRIFIEVKTTKQGNLFPFFVSANEVAASTDFGQAYRLYRVYDFGAKPHLFVLRGAIDTGFALRPVTYEARLKPASPSE